MSRYTVEFKAFKTGIWYTKTETDSTASAHSVAMVSSQGRAYRVTDNQTGQIILEDDGDFSMYNDFSNNNFE